MLNFSPEKLMLVGVIALVVLGPHRLPQAARTLGRLMAEFRRVSAGVQEEVRGALAEPTEAFHAAMGDFRPPTNIGRSVRDVIATTLTPAPTTPAGGRPGAGAPVPQDVVAPAAAPDDPSLN